GEVVVEHRHRYLKNGAGRPPRFLAVRREPDVPLLLAEPPRGVREGGAVSRIELRLAPAAAERLERGSRGNGGRPGATGLGGGGVTVKKFGRASTGGRVQISTCARGAGESLLERLEASVKVP